MKKFITLVGALALALSPYTAFADYDIDTGGTTAGNTQFGSLVVSQIGQSFTTLNGTDVLTSVETSFIVNAGVGQSIQLYLMSNSAGNPSGIPLDTSTVVGVQANCTARVTATFSGAIPVTDATTYWIVSSTTGAVSAINNNQGCGDTDSYAGGTQERFIIGTGWSDQGLDSRMIIHFTTPASTARPKNGAFITFGDW